MLTTTEARERVARGSAYLDETFPRWAGFIDVASLDLSNKCRCVLGQLDGDYWDAINNRRIFKRHFWQRVEVSQQRAVDYGFDADDAPFLAQVHHDYALLQDAWVEAIAARRHPVREPAEQSVRVTMCEL